jgi:hypothetical protein
MSNENLTEDPQIVNSKFEQDEQLRKIRDEVLKKFQDYRTTLTFMETDAPLGILCLPIAIENALCAHGCLRIYDLFNCDFTEVKGLGIVRIRQLTSCLDKFFSML